MNPIVIAALLGALCTPLGALGGLLFTDDNSLTPPKDMPPSFRTECGSCHALYPPNLLSAAGWRTIMDDLRTHFGDNAALEEPVRRQIEQYLVDHAGSSDRRFGSRTDPPRLTTTPWFRRNHGGVRSYFANVRVGSPANCSACHPRTEDWRYAKEDVVLPELPRRK